MNERIQLLAEQSTKHYPATETSGEFSTFDKEKFAELIVQECADVVKYYHSRNESVTPGQILQHFGVEE